MRQWGFYWHNQTDGQQVNIKVYIFGLPNVQSRQMKRNPLGGLVLSYTSENHYKHYEGVTEIPMELQKMQTAVPTFPFSYWYKFMSKVEVDQMVDYLSGLAVREWEPFSWCIVANIKRCKTAALADQYLKLKTLHRDTHVLPQNLDLNIVR